MSTITLPYIDKLQRQNADDLAFYPLTTLGKALEERHVISCEDNGEPAGSSADSNEFWQAAGFWCTRVQPGGIKRGRDLNCYRTDLQPGLLLLPSVTPSDRPIDLTAYNRQKRDGIAMPSRFSRTHYKAPA